MKLGGYVERGRAGGVRVLERQVLEVALEDVLARGLGSIDPLLPRGAAALAPLRDEEARVGGWNHPAPLRWRDATGALHEHEGLLLYEAVGDCLAFLLERTEPTGDDPFSRLLTSVRADPGARLELESLVIHGQPLSQPWRRRQFVEAEAGTVRVPCVANHELRDWLLEAPLRAARGRTASAARGQIGLAPNAERYQRGPILHLVEELDVGGRAVPVGTSVLAIPEPGCGGSVQDGPALVVERGRLRAIARLGDLERSLRRRLDARGRVFRSPRCDVLPARLAARALVRLPAPAELEGVAPPRRAPGRRSPLARPARVLDSRDPIALTGREPVLDDPRLAAWLLASTSRGVYVPDGGAPDALALALAELPPEPSWAVLCDVAA